MTVTAVVSGKFNHNEFDSESPNRIPNKNYKKTCRKCIHTFAIALTCTFLFMAGFTFCSQLRFIKTGSNGRFDNDDDYEFGSLTVISRDKWVAQPPENALQKLELPLKQVIIAHTGTKNCTTRAACINQVRLIQHYETQSKGWDDIGYNFLIGGDGAIYIGRGWHFKGKHTANFNAKSICIAFIGEFNENVPPTHQLDTAQRLIEEGVKQRKISANYDLYGQCQLKRIKSPGLALFQIIQKWNRWTNATQSEM